ncbi:hypothetical protein [Erythrobacter sp. WG]|uniref:hypothetical protein n=1 Tax=Erythrobacter sp. WG TaxID=2985510 RepID=UPI00226DA9E0|nr:hypothetical protein [Erythrobacter sp. WG]MCX9148015.1 hypothetical protein [Erythrobacter sp. WG]
MSAVAALIAAAATCLAGWWLGTASLSWIEAHREAVALVQPWVFPAILALIALGMMQRRNGAGA